MKRLITTTILLFIGVITYGYYPFIHNYLKSEYKGGSKNWQITQGECGNMWLANDAGIIEYDGKEWGITPVTNKTSVRSVLYDNETDRLIFGAINELGYLDFSDNSGVRYVSLLDSIGNNINDIWRIHKLDNALYFRENNRIFRYKNAEVKEYNFNAKVTVSEVIDGQLYIFVNSIGPLRLNDRGDFEKLPGTESLSNMAICSIIKHENGNYIEFVSATNGLYSYKDGVLKHLDSSLLDGLDNSIIYCARTNGKHTAYGTVNNGVYIYEHTSQDLIHLNMSSGLQNNTILDVFFDKQGNLWLGLDKGIDMVQINSAEYSLLASSNIIGAGYASEIYEGYLWLGTNQGLFTMKNSKIEEISELKGQIWSLLSHDGNLFCSCDRGLGIIDEEQNTRFIPLNGSWKLTPLKQNTEYMLGCSYDRLFLLKKQAGKWEFYNWISGFDENSKVFEEDNNGDIWFSHWIKGLYRLKIDLGRSEVIEKKYFSKGNGLPQDWGNVPIWFENEIIFQTAHGFYRIDRKTDKAYPIVGLNSLFSTPPAGMSIFQCGNSDLFFSSSTIQALCYRTSNNKDITSRDILLSNSPDKKGITIDSLSLRSLCLRRISGFEDIRELKDGLIMVNTEDGFSVINTDKIKENRSLPNNSLYIKEISITKADKDSVIFVSRKENNKEAKLTIPFKDNSLKFKVSLPIYNIDGSELFSYRLKGYDKVWSKFQESEAKEYSHIPPGNYTFQVRASLANSIHTVNTEINFKIMTPWYRKWWAYLLYILIGLIILMYTIHTFRLKIENNIAEKQKLKDNAIRQQQMSHELKIKADELASSTMNLIRKNEILRKIDSELQKAEDTVVEDRNKSLKIINKVRQNIRENISLDNNWNKFEKNFDMVYVDFLKKLDEHHPELSITDKKLCAYLKMGLSSKEIAPLLNITVRSVEMNRYRVRKKLGLNREDNLMDYLNRY